MTDNRMKTAMRMGTAAR